MAVLVAFLVLLLTETGNSQSVNHVNNTNILMRSFCGYDAPENLSNFHRNRNSSFDQLRTKLLTNGEFYARATGGDCVYSSGGDSVFALARCWNYLSVVDCVACFDDAVSVLLNCTDGNGAYALFDNCVVRYDDSEDYYKDPTVKPHYEDGAQYSSCGNQSSSQPISIFDQTVDRFLSEIRDVTLRTSNFYVASTRQITIVNATVYAMAVCVEIINQAVCRTCMNTAYDKLKNCLPSTEGMYFDLGCFARYSKTKFFNDNQIKDLTNVLKGNSRKVATIAGTSGDVGLLLIILILWFMYRLRKKSKKSEQSNFVSYALDVEDLEGAIKYNYQDLNSATSNFSKKNIIGKGGFGEVFKATLDDMSVVAVKRLHLQNARAKMEFENEVKLITNIHHRNLLRLLGWSTEEGSDLLLVLEYIPNGSLDQYLWGAKKGTLSWTQRYEIIFGVARGLAHLHNEFHVKIIHRDIKSSNILLTDDFKPKIADFGLARFQPEDQSHLSTKFAGTLGYTAPEYALRGLLSDKVDTYSFGIVILEIVSGRRSTEVISESTDFLLENAWKLYEKKIHSKLIDETLDLNQHEREHVMKIIEIALLCTQSPASDRPTMSEVVTMLQEGRSLGKRQLTRPTFVHNLDRKIHIGTSRNPILSKNAYEKPNKIQATQPLDTTKADN